MSDNFLSGSTVLIVDDSPANLKVVAKSLENSGAELLVAVDGEEGLRLAEMPRPDLILLDVMTPGLDVFEICHRLKGSPATCGIPVIFIISLSDVADKFAGLVACGVDYLTKPLQLDEVKVRINSHLRLNAIQRQLEDKNALLQAEIAERSRLEQVLREQMETELHRRGEAFRAIAENTPDTISRYDRNCQRIYVNPSLARLLGGDKLLSGTPEQSYAQSISSQGFQRAIEESIATGREGEYTLSWRAADERMLWSHIRIVPERDTQGNIVSVLAIGRDISNLLESDRRLQESRDLLRKLLVRQEVIYDARQQRASWEIFDSLGQLLFVQRMDIEILQRSTISADAAQVARLEKMRAVIDKAIGIVRSVSAEMRPTVFNMGVALALDWIVAEFQKETHLECELSLMEGEISLEETRANILFHIVRDALDNIQRNAEASHVSITLQRDNNYYVLQLRDDGKGMDLDAPLEGNLGLLFIQELVYAVDGEVVLLSEKGKGSLLEVRLPV
jgi:PAS domain S-box-containing protein